jgi:hypothetical protein
VLILSGVLSRSIWLLLACLALAAPASAQHAFELVGVRALGMGGAFVGVADDASAVYWNPAGLLSGPAVGATIGWDRFQLGNQQAQPGPGPRSQSGLLNSLGGWPLGLSYARFQTSSLRPGLAGETLSDTLVTREFGVTILQSLVQGLVVGSTLKYVRGGFATANTAGSTVEDALDAAADLELDSSGTFDFDLGVMADMHKLRVGLVLKNMNPPTFADPAGFAIAFDRHARLGVAVLPTSGVTLAMDLDLDTVDLRDGLRRNFALGAESRLASRLVARGGVRWSLTGARRLVAAAGASVAIRQGLWVDGYASHGAEETARGFGVAFRAAY